MPNFVDILNTSLPLALTLQTLIHSEGGNNKHDFLPADSQMPRASPQCSFEPQNKACSAVPHGRGARGPTRPRAAAGEPQGRGRGRMEGEFPCYHRAQPSTTPHAPTTHPVLVQLWSVSHWGLLQTHRPGPAEVLLELSLTPLGNYC